MRVQKEEEKVNKLSSAFLSLDEKDQEHIFGFLQALLFAKLKADMAVNKSMEVSVTGQHSTNR